jgi:hypothetical protein
VYNLGVYNNEGVAVEQETDDVYPLATGDVVILQEGGKVMLTERVTDVD